MRSFLDVIQSRKSVRSFRPDPVPHSLIEKIVAVGVQAPTNCNQQRWNVVVVEDKQTKQRLISEAAGNTLLQRTPTALVVTYDGWNYKEALQGASLMVGHMLLAAEYYGLGALPMNSYGSDRKIKKLLNIPGSQTICCFVLLGYPDAAARAAVPVSRRPVSEVLHYRRFKPKDTVPFTYDPQQWSLEDLRAHHRYYARKTVGGKEMDIVSRWERLVVRDALAPLRGSVADLLSYDGAYLREYTDATVTTFDLDPVTQKYSSQAVLKTVPERAKYFRHKVYADKKANLGAKFDHAAIIFKLERLSQSARRKLFQQTATSLKPGGGLVAVFRARNPLLWLSLEVMKKIFGQDIRRTGIFAFFGPYALLSPAEVVADLQRSGFKDIQMEGYFPFPAIFERFFQMVLQYLASDGSSYLHRLERTNAVTKLISAVLSWQGLLQVGRFGSVVVVRAKR